MKYVVPFVLALTGCATTNIHSVNLPKQLPTYHATQQKVLPQAHYLTKEEIAKEVGELRILSSQLSQNLNNLKYWYMSWFIVDLNALVDRISDKIEQSDNEDELLFYRRLLHKCILINDHMYHFYEAEKENYQDVYEQFNTYRKYK